MKYLQIFLIFFITLVACKTRRSSESLAALDHGQWTSICSLAKYDNTLYSHKIDLSFSNSNFASQTNYYSDGGCQTKLFQINRTGNTQTVENAKLPSKLLMPTNLTMTIFDPKMITQYNNTGLGNGNWVAGQAQNTTPTKGGDNQWGVVQFQSNTQLRFYSEADTTVLNGLLFLKQ